jgi:hypothetical protein
MEKIQLEKNLDDSIKAALVSLTTNVLFSEKIKKSEKNQEIYKLFKETLLSNNVEKSMGYCKKLDKAVKFMVSMRKEAEKNKNNAFIEVLKKWAGEAKKNFPPKNKTTD